MTKLSLTVVLLWALFSGYAQKREPLVMISTSQGDMIIKLYNETPNHRDNFLKLAGQGKYDGTHFHRIISNFMIQGGKIDDVGYTLPAEIESGLFHKKGAVAAARQPDAINPEKRSSGSQFYIVEGRAYSPKALKRMESSGKTFSKEQVEAYTTIGGAPNLDGEYTVFGEVVMGLPVLEKISKMKTNEKDRPQKTVKMNVKILE